MTWQPTPAEVAEETFRRCTASGTPSTRRHRGLHGRLPGGVVGRRRLGDRGLHGRRATARGRRPRRSGARPAAAARARRRPPPPLERRRRCPAPGQRRLARAARRRPARSGCATTRRAPWFLDCILSADRDGLWVSQRDRAHVVPLADVTWVADDGIRYLRPEVVLHHKARLRPAQGHRRPRASPGRCSTPPRRRGCATPYAANAPTTRGSAARWRSEPCSAARDRPRQCGPGQLPARRGRSPGREPHRSAPPTGSGPPGAVDCSAVKASISLHSTCGPRVATR